MAAKIKLSYTNQEELQEVVNLLNPKLKNIKISKNNDGIYKKAYIELKN